MTDHLHLRRGAVLASLAFVVLASCGGGGDPERPPSATRPSVPAGRILFSQTVGEHKDIYAIRPDGRGLRRLTKSQGEAVWPEPSPDGRQIAYEDDEATRAVIALIDADGGHRRVLTPSGFQGQPAWSPDGRWIAFGRDPPPGDNGIWLMRPDGSDLRRLTRNPYAGAECGCDGDPAFSPDGKRISFVRVRAERRGRGALFVMNRDGSNVRRLTPWTFDPGVNHTWAPDSSLILVSSNAHPEPGESSNVYVLRPDGTGLRALTRFAHGTPNALAGSWSPDGRQITLKTDESGDYQLYVMRADGSNRRRITTNLSEPSGIMWAP
jgi:Tol biopolymer transport system component